jgi:hypothetical protein
MSVSCIPSKYIMAGVFEGCCTSYPDNVEPLGSFRDFVENKDILN